LPTEVVFWVGAPPELLVIGILGEQITVIAKINSVFLFDALGVGKSWLKVYEKRYNDLLFIYTRAYPSAKTLISVVWPAKG
jgi:hypothetical protein